MMDPPGPAERREFARGLARHPRDVWWELDDPCEAERRGLRALHGLGLGGLVLLVLLGVVSWPWAPGVWWALGWGAIIVGGFTVSDWWKGRR